MRKEIGFNEELKEVLNQLPKGAFLTVKDGEKINIMSIGWATFGVIWNKPMLMVAIRKSRYTYELMNNAKDFTVSVPVNVDLRKALKYCGTYSGRDVNKAKECNLTFKKANKVDSPIIAECDYHYECKTLFSQFMDPELLDENIKDRHYPNDNYHMFYFAEIVDSYKF